MTKIEAKKLSAGELVCDFFFLAIPFELSREFLVWSFQGQAVHRGVVQQPLFLNFRIFKLISSFKVRGRYWITSFTIRWSSSSVTLLSFKAFKTRLFTLSPFEDARENNFSCFETFVRSFLLTEAETMETTTPWSAMLPSRMLATRPISVKAVPRLTVVETSLKIEASRKIGSTAVFGFFIDFFQIVGNLDKSKAGRIFSNSFQLWIDFRCTRGHYVLRHI